MIAADNVDRELSCKEDGSGFKIATTIASSLSDGAAYIIGKNIRVDGGVCRFVLGACQSKILVLVFVNAND